jgi:type VI protein secretion system component VasF
MASEVFQIVYPMMTYLGNLRSRIKSDSDVNSDDIRNELKQMHTTIEKRVKDIQTPGKTISKIDQFPDNVKTQAQLIGYIMVGLSDSVMIDALKKNKSLQNEWIENPLENEIFGRRSSGDLFDSLMIESESSQDLAEVFYGALCMGFTYDNEKTKVAKKRLFQILPDSITKNNKYLSPGSSEAVSAKEKKLPPYFGYTATFVMIAVSILFYLISSNVLWKIATDDIRNTAEIIRQLEVE